MGRGTRTFTGPDGVRVTLPAQDVLTDETAKMIEDHDCTGVRLCGWAHAPGDCR